MPESKELQQIGKSKFPSLQTVKKSGLRLAEQIPDLASSTVAAGRDLAKTKTGSRALTGAVAGGVIAAALPFVSITAGILFGAGALVMWKTAKDEEL